jgi:hypothetical protein
VSGGDECGPTAGIIASSRVDDPVSSAVVGAQPGAAVSFVAASAPTFRARSVALQGRNSEEGRSAIMRAEVVLLAAARRELDSVRVILDVLGGSITDCTAAVATARRHLGVGGSGDDREA